jgi:hypothetical protein
MTSQKMYQFSVPQQAYMSLPAQHHYPAEQKQVHTGSMTSVPGRGAYTGAGTSVLGGGVATIEMQQFGAAERQFDSYMWARNGKHTCSDVVAQGGRTDVGPNSSSHSSCMNPTVSLHKSAPSINAAYFEAERHPSKYRSGRDSLHNVSMTLSDGSISTELLGAPPVAAQKDAWVYHDRDLSMYNVTAENTTLPPAMTTGFFEPLQKGDAESTQGCSEVGESTSMCYLST